MTSRSVLWLRDRPKLWIASCLIVAAAVGIPRVLSSRFVSERRVAHGLQRARAQLAAREFEQVRRELRGVLRLELVRRRAGALGEAAEPDRVEYVRGGQLDHD